VESLVGPSICCTPRFAHHSVGQATQEDLYGEVTTVIAAQGAAGSNRLRGHGFDRGGDVLPAAFTADDDARGVWGSLEHEPNYRRIKSEDMHRREITPRCTLNLRSVRRQAPRLLRRMK
jgi:hypothetical protein